MYAQQINALLFLVHGKHLLQLMEHDGNYYIKIIPKKAGDQQQQNIFDGVNTPATLKNINKFSIFLQPYDTFVHQTKATRTLVLRFNGKEIVVLFQNLGMHTYS